MSEAEVLEIGQVSDGVGGDLAGETAAREAELDDRGIVVVAEDAFPGTRGQVGHFPQAGAAAYGRAEAEQGGSVGRQVRFGSREEKE